MFSPAAAPGSRAEENARHPQAARDAGADEAGRLNENGPDGQGAGDRQPGKAHAVGVGVFEEEPGEAHGAARAYAPLVPEKVRQQAEEAALRREERSHEKGQDGRDADGQAAHDGHGQAEPVERCRVADGAGQKAAEQGFQSALAEPSQQGESEGIEKDERRAVQDVVGKAEPQAQGNEKSGRNDGRTAACRS